MFQVQHLLPATHTHVYILSSVVVKSKNIRSRILSEDLFHITFRSTLCSHSDLK